MTHHLPSTSSHRQACRQVLGRQVLGRQVLGRQVLVAILLASAAFLAGVPAAAQPIHQERGIDARVDYAALTEIGPWDDRNYQLTLEDLAYLRQDEKRFRDPIPVFYRVGIRRAWLERREGGIEFYPRSAVPAFKQNYGGFLVDGELYREVTYKDGRFQVSTERPVISHEEYLAQKAFAGEVIVNDNSAESAVKIHPTNPSIIIGGSNGPSGNEMHFSSDGGATWGETSLPLGGTCCDPTVDWNADGTLAHTATLGDCQLFAACEIWYYRSDDDGQSWSDLEDQTPGDPRRELTATGSDKEFIHVDKFVGSPHQDNVYLTWHDGNVIQFARSTDDGNTWSITSLGSDPRGIGSDVTSDKSGNVYHFWPSLEGEGSSRVVMKKSTNGGSTFAAGVTKVADMENEFDFGIPVMETRLVFTYVSADVDYSSGAFGDSIYVSWTDSTAVESGTTANNHARIQVAYSRDGGSTWTTTTPHPTADQNTVDRFHQWLAVGEDGTVWVAFYETLPGDRQQVHFVYTKSTDGGQTWTAPAILTSGPSGNPNDSFEWGDYNGLDVVGDQLVAIYTDNRNEGGGGGDDIDVYAIGLEVEGGNSAIFSDDFESGDVSAWSSSAP